MIRFATKEDRHAIAQLVLVILKDMELPLLAELGEPMILTLLEEAIQNPQYRYGYARGLVLELEGQVVGIAFGYPNDQESIIDLPFSEALIRHGFSGDQLLFTDAETMPNEWYLDTISVDARYRGQGLGSQLLEALPKLALRENRQKIGLNVDQGNPEAKKLYTRHGFHQVGEMMLSNHLYDHLQKNISR